MCSDKCYLIGIGGPDWTPDVSLVRSAVQAWNITGKVYETLPVFVEDMYIPIACSVRDERNFSVVFTCVCPSWFRVLEERTFGQIS